MRPLLRSMHELSKALSCTETQHQRASSAVYCLIWVWHSVCSAPRACKISRETSCARQSQQMAALGEEEVHDISMLASRASETSI